jgi:hypothetical protein
VQVEVSGVPKAWMPIELLIALVNLNQNEQQIKTATGTATN